MTYVCLDSQTLPGDHAGAGRSSFRERALWSAPPGARGFEAETQGGPSPRTYESSIFKWRHGPQSSALCPQTISRAAHRLGPLLRTVVEDRSPRCRHGLWQLDVRWKRAG